VREYRSSTKVHVYAAVYDKGGHGRGVCAPVVEEYLCEEVVVVPLMEVRMQ
jgi:CRISPR/Cas system-associated protein Csm6